MPFKIIIFIFCLFASSTIAETARGQITGEEVKDFLSGFKLKKVTRVETLTFQDGSKYIGSFKKNIIHGEGKFIDKDGNISEGKWRYGRLNIKIDKKTRKVIKINKLTGVLNFYETRGSGSLYNRWFEAIPKEVNVKKIKELEKLDFFDQPSAIFSSVYSDKKHIQKKLDAKNAEIRSKNLKTSSDPSNIVFEYQLTDKGKKDMKRAKVVASNESNITGDEKGSTSSGSQDPGAGGFC